MDSEFDKFQIEEYKNISNSHFEANKQIGVFFRYYLLIASAPTLIFLWFGKDNSNVLHILNSKDINLCLFVGFFLLAISFIGIILCFYIINFRLDSILYARTVNGIRKYFFNKEKPLTEDHIRVLPKQTNQPRYMEFHTFTIIVIAVAFINSIYFGLGTRVIATVGDNFFNEYFPFKIPIYLKNYDINWALLVSVIVFALHFFYYKFFSNYRNFSYMKKLIIGVDIDGVLNKHRDTFCTFLYKNVQKTLWADEIIKIPVSLISGKNIKRQDEFIVFNDIDYWIQQQPIDENIGKIINELKNAFGYRIHIFSYRAWPDTTYLPKDMHHQTLEKWESFYLKKYKFGRIFIRLFNSKKTLRFKTITKITQEWLKTNKISYDKLLIEKGSIDVKSIRFNFLGIPRINFNNRYYKSRRYSFRYFIEDTLENAIKLSVNCEYVFLIDHPYNQRRADLLPSNIIRVNSWSEIREKIRELG